jgi:hypothetical protein
MTPTLTEPISETISDTLFESIAELRYHLESPCSSGLSMQSRHLLEHLIVEMSNAVVALDVPEFRELLAVCQEGGF